MTGFYRKHIHNYAKIATPLTNLTRKTQNFKWTSWEAVAEWIRGRAWGRTDVDAWVRTPPVLL